MCFQCGETSCENYQPEAQERFEKLIKDDDFMERFANAVGKEGQDSSD